MKFSLLGKLWPWTQIYPELFLPSHYVTVLPRFLITVQYVVHGALKIFHARILARPTLQLSDGLHRSVVQMGERLLVHVFHVFVHRDFRPHHAFNSSAVLELICKFKI